MYFFRTRKPTSKFGFAFFLFGLTLITQLFHGYNFDYYLNSGLVSITYATICKIIFVVVDWLNDLLFGALSEHTKSRFGKRVPWLIFGSAFIPIFVILTYVVNKDTAFSPIGFLLWYIIISVCLENASTVMYTNYNALFPTLFTTGNDRSKTASYKHIFEILGMIGCYLLTPIFTADLGIPYWVVGCIYAVIYFITLFVCLKTMRIKDDIKAEELDNQTYSFKATIKDVWNEKPFIIFNIAQSFFASILSIVVSLYPMYCRYVLKLTSGWENSACLGGFFGSLLLSIPVWYFFIRKYGHNRTWLFSFIGLPLACFCFFFPHDFVSGIIVCCLVGPFFGGLMISPDMIGAELIDIDKLKHHVSREAALGSVGTLIGRISVILTAIATAILAMAFGYENGTNPGPNPAFTFQICFGVMLPIIALFGTAFAIVYIIKSRPSRLALSALKKKSGDETTEVSINDILGDERLIQKKKKPNILVSACLLGKKTRYDGKSNLVKNVLLLYKYFNVIPICPEQEGGLPTPRTPSEIRGNEVISKDGKDVTINYQKGANVALQVASNHQVVLAILKEKSPSCGVHFIHDGNFEGQVIEGQGKTTELLKANNIPCFNEKEIKVAIDYYLNHKEELIKEKGSQ